MFPYVDAVTEQSPDLMGDILQLQERIRELRAELAKHIGENQFVEEWVAAIGPVQSRAAWIRDLYSYGKRHGFDPDHGDIEYHGSD